MSRNRYQPRPSPNRAGCVMLILVGALVLFAVAFTGWTIWEGL